MALAKVKTKEKMVLVRRARKMTGIWMMAWRARMMVQRVKRMIWRTVEKKINRDNCSHSRLYKLVACNANNIRAWHRENVHSIVLLNTASP